ncbi:hypothetical protein VPH35_081486 [Triticum aestivum]
MGSRNDLKKLKSSIGDEPKIDGELLKRVKEVGGEEHTAMLRAVICLPSEEGVAPKPIQTLDFVDCAGLDATIALSPKVVGHVVSAGDEVSTDKIKKVKKALRTIGKKSGVIGKASSAA